MISVVLAKVWEQNGKMFIAYRDKGMDINAIAIKEHCTEIFVRLCIKFVEHPPSPDQIFPHKITRSMPIDRQNIEYFRQQEFAQAHRDLKREIKEAKAEARTAPLYRPEPGKY